MQEKIFIIVGSIIGAIVLASPIILIYIIGTIIGKIKMKRKRKTIRTKYKVREDVPIYRDIPCNKDIFKAYWFARNYHIIKREENLLGAVIMKWLSNGNIIIKKINKEGLFKERKENIIVFEKRPKNNPLEIKLYDYMVKASVDNELESDEFEEWCEKNFNKIFNWFENVLNFENQKFKDEKKIKIIKKGIFFKHKELYIDNSLMKEAEKLAGLKKFLQEFTKIKEREPIEVKLWNDYLIYAQLFGVADEVAKQLKKLYPEVIENTEILKYDYKDIELICDISYDIIKMSEYLFSNKEVDTIMEKTNETIDNINILTSPIRKGYSSKGGGSGSYGSGKGGGGFR